MQLAILCTSLTMAPKRTRSRGENHPKAVLTDREVELMRQLHEGEGWGYRRLAKKFDCPRNTAVDICNYRRR